MKQQIFVSTHSSNITAVAGLDNMYMLDYKRDIKIPDVRPRKLEEQFLGAEDAKKHMMKFLDVTRSDMLFASRVILVEGIAEKLLMPRFMKRLGCPYEDEHISIVEIGGKHFEHFIRVYADNPIDKKVLCITDKDYSLTEKIMINGKEETVLKSVDEYINFCPGHVERLNSMFKDHENIKIAYQTGLGRTFEDEMFLSNLETCMTPCKLLRIALSPTLHKFLGNNCLSIDNWDKNRDAIDGRSQEKIHRLIDLTLDAQRRFPKEKDSYAQLFLANLFLSYAKDKKGDVALQMLIDENLMKEINVPKYIKDGLEWLLK